MIHTGDCIEVMRGLEAESVDAIVTDPPYGLEFMGKAWDKFGKGKDDQLPDMRAPTAPGLLRSPVDAPQSEVRHPSSGAESQATAGFSADGMGKGFRALPSFLGGLNPRCKACGKSQRGGSPCKCERPDFTNEILPRVAAFQAWCTEWGTEALRVTKPAA
jgi:site-specific DNA-methyltransferase (adenine-specific)